MAKMFPHFINDEEKIWPGEEKTYYFLKKYLPKDFSVFHDILILERHPDFIVVSPDIGIRIIEVKDWSLSYIKRVDKEYFTLYNEKIERNPYKQATKNMGYLSWILGKEKTLLQSNGDHKGKLKFIRGCGVIFPNMTNEEFKQINVNYAIYEKYILFKNDIEAIENSGDTDFLISWLKNLYKPIPLPPLTVSEIELIGTIITGEYLKKAFKEKMNIYLLLEKMQEDIDDIKKTIEK